MSNLGKSMKNISILTAACLAVVLGLMVAPADTPPTTRPATKPATKPAPPAKPLTETEKAAIAGHDLLVDAYLKNDFEAIEANLKVTSAGIYKLSTEQRANVEYIRRAAQEQRPTWWPKTKSSANSSFQSGIWGKPLMTNYVPADELGVQMPVDVRDGKLIMVVSWRPTNVDNPRAADGALAKTLGVTKGDIGEVVVWHELGHLFISSAFSADTAYELYTKYELLYGHLQEFFADMTAIYHATPHARRIALVLRLDSLDPPYGKYREIEPHTRGANAIGSMFLSEVLMDPSKWPNVHLPPKVPETEPELKTIVYVYEHFTATWTFAEDKAMREWALKVVKTQGDQIFRSKGMIPLQEKNSFSLMEAQDREFQKKRDAWVTSKLNAAIAAKLTDKEPPASATMPGNHGTVITINGHTIRTGDQMPPRIEVPIY